MSFGYISGNIAIMLGSAALFLGLLFYIGVLITNDTICIARTAIHPEEALFTDQERFNEQVQELRDDVLGVILRQYDESTGLFTYSEHPNGEVSSQNNAIRQLLASRVLALESREDETLRGVHVGNIRGVLREWYKEEGSEGYVLRDSKSKLGANAMLLRTLVASPFFNTYEREAAALVRGILSLQEDDGSFKAWYVEPDYTYDEAYLLTFYSGEAILALLEYAERTGDKATFEAAIRSQEYYLNLYVTEIEANYYPAYVPWHSQSLSHLYVKTGDKNYAEALFILNDRLLLMQDKEEFVGRFYNEDTPEYGSPHAASDAVYVEGLAHAHAVAEEVGDNEREKRYYEALVYGIHNLERLQYEHGLLSFFGHAEASKRLSGGIMTRACSSWVRIDTLAHSVDAFNKILEEAK